MNGRSSGDPAVASASPSRALVLATISFTVSFAAWGLIGGLASVFNPLYGLTASQTALLVAVPVLLGSLARLPMGMLTDRWGGRLVFTALLAFSAFAAFAVTLTDSYRSLLVAAFFIGMAGSSFAVGAAFVSRWTPAARQGTALGIYGLGTMGQSHAAAAKAGIDSLTRTLAVEWGPHRIRVNGIAPGPIDGTEGVRRLTNEASREHAVQSCPMGRLGTVDDIAHAALYLCSDAASYVNGVTLVVDGGLWLRSARILGES